MRPLMEKALQTLLEKNGKIPLVLAPTGYGKTKASIEIEKEAISNGIARGLVHVVPLRSLVRRIYNDIFKGIPSSGYQMSSSLSDHQKSPYFMRRLVVTTIDSYLWNMFRVPILEYYNLGRKISSGRYYPVAATILSSVNVLDEAHVYLGEGSTETATATVLAAVQYLAYTNTPTLIETATMHPGLINRLYAAIRRARKNRGGGLVLVVWKCLAQKLSQYLNLNLPVEQVDENPNSSVHQTWITTIEHKNWSDDTIKNEIAQFSKDGPVLVVANTVKRAVSIYNDLKSITDTDVVLLHGRLGDKDRNKAEDKVASMREGIIVATQVVEVGVDINSIAVYTDPAPLENLVQRAGRACRRGNSLSYCNENGGKIVIIAGSGQKQDMPYNLSSLNEALRLLTDVINKGKTCLDWRNPCPRNGVTPYYDLIARSKTSDTLNVRNLTKVLREYLKSDGRPLALLNYLDIYGICNLYRASIMVPLMTEQGFVLASIDWALKGPGRDYLEKCRGTRIPCLLAIHNGEPCDKKGVPAKKIVEALGSGKCSTLAEAIQKDLSIAAQKCSKGKISYAFKTRVGAYKEGIGLV